MRIDRLSVVLELVRWQGRGLGADPAASQVLMEVCTTATELGAPLDLLSAGLCVLEIAGQRLGVSTATIRNTFPQAAAHQRQLEALNSQELGQVKDHLDTLTLAPEQVLLLGDAALMLALYGTLRAFRASTWAIGLPAFAGVGEQSITEPAVKALPFEISFGKLGRLEERLGDLTRVCMLDGVLWRIPDRDLTVVLIAARVGELDFSSTNHTWAHLAAALMGHRGTIDVEAVLRLADELHLADRVQRGLAVTRLIFPELGRLRGAGALDIPSWELEALRPAAGRLMQRVLGDTE